MKNIEKMSRTASPYLPEIPPIPSSGSINNILVVDDLLIAEHCDYERTRLFVNAVSRLKQNAKVASTTIPDVQAELYAQMRSGKSISYKSALKKILQEGGETNAHAE